MENIKNNPDIDYENFIKGVEPDTTELKMECTNLLLNTGYTDDEKSEIEKELWYYSEDELNRLKADLCMNQIDHIENGLNYNQGDIKRKLKNI